MEKSHTMVTQERTVHSRHFSARFMATVLRIFSKIHIIIYHWTGGIIGGRIFGNRMLLLTTTGRKTGQPRTTPVAYLTDRDTMIIVGGAAGAAKHPDWWLNLQSHPEAQVQVGKRRLRVSATRALPEEQRRLLARYPAQHALFESMQKRVSREIPVVILRPLSESSLAYEIASEYWNRGLATEAAQGMIDYAFSHEEVRAVIALTLAQINASSRVLQKVGMKFIAEVDDPEEGKIWRWQISRDEYHPA